MPFRSRPLAMAAVLAGHIQERKNLVGEPAALYEKRGGLLRKQCTDVGEE